MTAGQPPGAAGVQHVAVGLAALAAGHLGGGRLAGGAGGVPAVVGLLFLAAGQLAQLAALACQFWRKAINQSVKQHFDLGDIQGCESVCEKKSEII